MKLSLDPRLPIFGGRDYERSLYQRLYALFREIAQANNSSDDSISGLVDDVGALQGDVGALQGDVAGILAVLPLLEDLADGLPWLAIPIGVPLPMWTHITGVDEPPTDNPAFRFIKLTASDSYNDGVLTSESVSGSAPLINATAVIDYSDSPLHGQTVRLINTEGRITRPGETSGDLQDDAFQNFTGTFTLRRLGSGGDMSGASGAFASTNGTSIGAVEPSGTSQAVQSIALNPSTVARTANETRMRNIRAEYFMRIL